MKTVFLVLFPIILGVVDLPCNYFTSPDYSTITNPQARWRAYGIRSYTIPQQHTCSCVNGGKQMRLTVRDNTIVNVQGMNLIPLPREQWSSYRTVDELFGLITNGNSYASLGVEYDARYGYPTTLSIDVIAEAVDDEFGYQTEGLQRMGK